MNVPAQIETVPVETLPALIDRASAALAAARTSAEVLEAKEMAGAVYDLAKRAARLHKAKSAHDELIAAAYRAQANALEIESRAKRRLADEYDAAQERGEVATQADGARIRDLIPNEDKVATLADLGIDARAIHEARKFRDAGEAVVQTVINDALADGRAPTRAEVRRAVKGEPAQAVNRGGGRITTPDGLTPEQWARRGMALEADGRSAEQAAAEINMPIGTYRRIRDMVLLFERDDLRETDAGRVRAALDDLNSNRQVRVAYELVADIAQRIWGGGSRAKMEQSRLEAFWRACGVLIQSCVAAGEIDIPVLSQDKAKEIDAELGRAVASVRAFRKRFMEMHQ